LPPEAYKSLHERECLERILLQNMHKSASDLQQLLDEANDRWTHEDGIYRFYHQSFKVFDLQSQTDRMTAALRTIAPQDQPFCELFQRMLRNGTGRTFKLEDNASWFDTVSPIVFAFLQARYFIEMAVRYAKELEEPPQPMASGWAALLCLYDIR
jgi:hypothetical protein